MLDRLRRNVPSVIRRNYALKFGIVLLLIGASVGMIGFFATEEIRAHVQDNADEEYATLAEQEAKSLQAWSESNEQRVETLIRSPELRSLTTTELRQYTQHPDRANAIHIDTGDGEIIASTDRTLTGDSVEELSIPDSESLIEGSIRSRSIGRVRTSSRKATDSRPSPTLRPPATAQSASSTPSNSSSTRNSSARTATIDRRRSSSTARSVWCSVTRDTAMSCATSGRRTAAIPTPSPIRPDPAPGRSRQRKHRIPSRPTGSREEHVVGSAPSRGPTGSFSSTSRRPTPTGSSPPSSGSASRRPPGLFS